MYQILDVEPYGKNDYTVTIQWTRKRLFRSPKVIVFKVRGGSTVWYYYPSGARMGTSFEYWMHGAFKAWQWRQQEAKDGALTTET